MRLRKVETFEGPGEVFLGDKSLGEVEYRIDVRQEIHQTRTGEEPGLLRISGRIRCGDDLLWKIREAPEASLHLDDDRWWNFMVHHWSLGSGGADVRGTSDFYKKS